MDLKAVIAIDDTHPEKGWGLKNDECTKYLIKLNEEFGCKFVHFIPSNYHNKFPISQFKDWVDYWKQFDWVELAAHGHFHNRKIQDSGCRECEFIELDLGAEFRIEQSLEEWDKAGVRPRGWRMPGWVATQQSFDVVSEYFDYVAIHGSLNDNIHFNNNIKVFKGEVPIHTGNVMVWDNIIPFQSHINGEYNKNNWNKENYKYFRQIIPAIKENNTIEFKTFSELC